LSALSFRPIGLDQPAQVGDEFFREFEPALDFGRIEFGKIAIIALLALEK